MYGCVSANPLRSRCQDRIKCAWLWSCERLGEPSGHSASLTWVKGTRDWVEGPYTDVQSKEGLARLSGWPSVKLGHQRYSVSPRNGPAFVPTPCSVTGWEEPVGGVPHPNAAMNFKAQQLGLRYPVGGSLRSAFYCLQQSTWFKVPLRLSNNPYFCLLTVFSGSEGEFYKERTFVGRNGRTKAIQRWSCW